jgi:hypothetical protein
VWYRSRRGDRRVGVRLGLRNYDFLAPSLRFLRPDGTLHTDRSLGVLLAEPGQTHVPPLVRNGRILLAKDGGYLPGNHPFTLAPFLCIRGVWEFHVHPQHADVLWEWIRADPGYGLQYVLEHSFRAFRPDLWQ